MQRNVMPEMMMPQMPQMSQNEINERVNRIISGSKLRNYVI